MTRSTKARIYHVDGKNNPSYCVNSEKDCKDNTDKSAYREYLRCHEIITMGHVIVMDA